jgi:RNA-directed DNA polymerase
MDFLNYKDAFTNGIQRGYSEQNIQRCLDYAAPLFSMLFRNLQYFSFVSISGLHKRYLKKAALHTKYFYRDFEVVKRNGKKTYLNHCPV